MSDRKNRFFKIPQTKTTVRANTVFAAGLIFVFLGIFFLVVRVIPSEKIIFARDVTVMALGIVFIFMAFAFTRNGLFVFLGIFAFLSGVTTLLSDVYVLPVPMKDLWPVFMCYSGIALIPAGLYKMRRARSIYLFPAITLVFLGIFFLIFSLNEIPFRLFIARWWPLLLLFTGGTLIALFVIQKNHAEEFPYLEDDSTGEDSFNEY